MICKNCGATIDEGANYCTQCGAGVNPTNAGRQAEQTAYQPNENAYYSAGPNPVYQQPFGGQAPQKSKIAAGLLAILLGSLGIGSNHRPNCILVLLPVAGNHGSRLLLGSS